MLLCHREVKRNTCTVLLQLVSGFVFQRQQIQLKLGRSMLKLQKYDSQQFRLWISSFWTNLQIVQCSPRSYISIHLELYFDISVLVVVFFFLAVSYLYKNVFCYTSLEYLSAHLTDIYDSSCEMSEVNLCAMKTHCLLFIVSLNTVRITLFSQILGANATEKNFGRKSDANSGLLGQCYTVWQKSI